MPEVEPVTRAVLPLNMVDVMNILIEWGKRGRLGGRQPDLVEF
jgi:hypothetical protein